MKHLLSLASGILFVLALVPYIRAILHGTRPSKTSWIVWATNDILALAGMIAAGAVNFLIVAATLGASTVAILALRYGKPGWTTADKLCLTGSAVGFALWGITSDPLTAILISQATILLGSWTTLKNVWAYPWDENLTAWMICVVGCVLSIAAIPAWDLANAVQPVTFFIIEATVTTAIVVRRRTLNSAPAAC